MNIKYKVINDNGEGVYEIVCDKSNIHYYVNENKKTVAAVMRDSRREFRNEMSKLIDKTLGFLWEVDHIYSCGLSCIKDTYRGKAHCIKNDEFNVEVGMKIAREHMLANYYIDRAAAFTAVAEIIGNLFSEIQYRAEMAFERADKFVDASNEHYNNAHGIVV